VNKFAQAAELYTQAIELLPTAIFYSNRAMAYIKQENYGLAIIDANEAIRYVVCYRAEQSFTTSFRIYRRDPNYLKAYYRRASANFALSKYKVALKDFKAGRTFPGFFNCNTVLCNV
jgi:serine/threonine-protein phosphatase 5